MQDLEREPSPYKPGPKGVWELLIGIVRYRSDPNSLEPFLDSLKEKGVPDPNLSKVRSLLNAGKNITEDRLALYRVDRYLTAGMGAIDLILLAVLLPIGASGSTLFVAVLALAISLVMTAVALGFTFIKRELHIQVYGKIHSTITSLSLLSGVLALTATFWHDSPLIGVVFLILAAFAYTAWLAYYAFAMTIIEFLRIVHAAPTQTKPDMSEPSVEGSRRIELE